MNPGGHPHPRNPILERKIRLSPHPGVLPGFAPESDGSSPPAAWAQGDPTPRRMGTLPGQEKEAHPHGCH